MKTSHADKVYEIRIRGHLAPHLCAWFEGWEITNLENGEALLRSSSVDQSGLHGALNKIRDLNLKLISVTSGGTPTQDSEKRPAHRRPRKTPIMPRKRLSRPKHLEQQNKRSFAAYCSPILMRKFSQKINLQTSNIYTKPALTDEGRGQKSKKLESSKRRSLK